MAHKHVKDGIQTLSASQSFDVSSVSQTSDENGEDPSERSYRVDVSKLDMAHKHVKDGIHAPNSAITLIYRRQVRV